MTKRIDTSVVIQAPPEKVWKLLTDFEKYPIWNPFIKSITGVVEVGKRIEVRIAPPDTKEMTFSPIVYSRVEYKELIWRGSVLFDGLFDGEHRFELLDNGDGTTTFFHSEVFSGLFVFLFNPKNTKIGFENMNDKLRAMF